MHNALFPEQCNVTNEIDNLKSNFQVHWNCSFVSWIINEILQTLDYMLEKIDILRKKLFYTGSECNNRFVLYHKMNAQTLIFGLIS